MVKLVVCDLDGTITMRDNVWMEIHRAMGTQDEARECYDRYMNGVYGSYGEWAEAEASLWKGYSRKNLMEIINDIPVHPGIEEFTSRCREHGLETMILSSGLNILADVIMEKYGFHHVLANELLFEDGLVTGRVIPHVPFDEKDRALLEYLQERGIAPLECVAIGDGANDIPMFKVCGHGIAFNPTADIHEHVDIVIDNADLRSVIPVIDKIINNPL